MSNAQQVVGEIGYLSRMGDDAFMDTVVAYVMGTDDPRVPRPVQGAALGSPDLAPRTLDALETALRRARSYNPIRKGENKRGQQARIAPWRARIKAATEPIQDVVDDLAHEHAKKLASLGDDAFRDRFTDFILGEQPPAPTSPRIEALGFRSHRVAKRAAAVCRLMNEDPGQFMPALESDLTRTAREKKVREFRWRVEAETAFLRYGIQYAEARHGRMPAEPNVRLQALKVLGERHPEELSALLRNERGGELDRAAAARRERRALRRAARTGAR
ncbi:hypothetical protein ACIBAC_00405 [Streptomyces sp. NPDC051362]|uniref:hypothetical protein n=1 Tax=Streptomyces sp. NPDC051362 TaxID=3365651 RepID=UPI0037B7B4FF